MLLVAIPLSIYLVRQQQILKGRAVNNSRIEFLTSAGAAIPDPASTTSRDIKVKLVFEPPTNTNTPTNTPTPTSAQTSAGVCAANENNCLSGFVGQVGPLVPLPNVNVSLSGPTSGTATPNANGIYKFTNLQNGQYTVSAPTTTGSYRLYLAVPSAFNSSGDSVTTGYSVNANTVSFTIAPGATGISRMNVAFAYFPNNFPLFPTPTSSPAPTSTYTVSGTLGLNYGGVSLGGNTQVSICSDSLCNFPIQSKANTAAYSFTGLAPGTYYVGVTQIIYTGLGPSVDCQISPPTAVSVPPNGTVNLTVYCQNPNNE